MDLIAGEFRGAVVKMLSTDAKKPEGMHYHFCTLAVPKVDDVKSTQVRTSVLCFVKGEGL